MLLEDGSGLSYREASGDGPGGTSDGRCIRPEPTAIAPPMISAVARTATNRRIGLRRNLLAESEDGPGTAHAGCLGMTRPVGTFVPMMARRRATSVQRSGTGTWTETGNMAVARSSHSATLLPDGKVLVAGGTTSVLSGPPYYRATREAELYDPVTGTWTATGSMKLGRWAPTAALLPGGNVLVVGGVDGGPVTQVQEPTPGSSTDNPDLRSAELYDPQSGTWTSVAPFAGAGACRIATALLNGEVLVVCAETSGLRTSAVLYDVASGSWSPTSAPPKECCLGEGGPFGSIVRLADGRVLWKDLVDPGELYDRVSGAWTSAGGPTYPADPSWGLPSVSTGNVFAGYKADTLTLLPDGRVLMTDEGAALLYDPNGGR